MNNPPWDTMGTRILALHATLRALSPITFQTDVFYGYIFCDFYPSKQMGCVIMHVRTPLTNHSQAMAKESTTEWSDALSTSNSN